MNSMKYGLGILLLILSFAASAQQYYRWVDANGTVHFSERPPEENVEAELEQVRDSHLTRGLGGPIGTAEEETPESGEQQTAAAPVNTTAGSTTNAEMCQRAQANLETLRSTPRVRRVDPDTGEVQMMSSEQRDQEMQRTQALVDQYC